MKVILFHSDIFALFLYYFLINILNKFIPLTIIL